MDTQTITELQFVEAQYQQEIAELQARSTATIVNLKKQIVLLTQELADATKEEDVPQEASTAPPAPDPED